MKKNENRSLILSLLVCILLTAPLTMAFTTREIETENVVTFGNLKMEILETELTQTGEERVFNPDESTRLRSDQVSRIVRVKNVCKEPMYVRISLSMEGWDEEGEIIPDAEELAAYEINEEDWVCRDGWYYYKQVLEPQLTSEKLMTEIEFDTDAITSDYPSGEFELKVAAQAVQAKNNAENVLEAKGW